MAKTNREYARALLLQEQNGKMNQEELINDIVTGQNTLLTAEDIADRLRIPINIFHKWVKNADPKYHIPGELLSSLLGEPTFHSALNFKEREIEKHKFAKPDVYIINQPRWTINTFKSWLRANMK